jgi:large subunit ribosomal protein L13
MKTVVVNTKSIKREWYLIDASDAVVGRLASKIANILMGASKVLYSPNQDHGDHVVVINSDKARVSGKKATMKSYFRHSTRPGSEKIRTFKSQMALDSRKVIVHAVHGMLPKKALGHSMIKKLHVYRGETHPHAAQKPSVIS